MSEEVCRILIVDDHALVREGIEVVLSAHPDLQVVASVESTEAALGACARERPDVVVLDVRLRGEDGLALLATLRQQHPGVKVLMLSSHEGDEVIHRALAGGAAGYVLKQAPSRALVDAIRAVARGERVAHGRVAELLASRVGSVPLSEREIAVLRRILHGESNKEIGESLGIGANTVKTHVNNLLGKLDAADRTQAVTIALQRGIITLED